MIRWEKSMKNLPKRLKLYRRRAHLNQNEVADLLGYKSFTTIQKWEDGTSQPSIDILDKLCDLYQVPFEVLVNGAPPIVNIPILGVVRGGTPIYASQEILGTHVENLSLIDQSDYFYLKVTGDSMKDARICDGDEILVQSQNQIENGQIGVILVGEEATVKRVYQTKKGIRLVPANEDYQESQYSIQEIESLPVLILGKVIANRIDIK